MDLSQPRTKTIKRLFAVSRNECAFNGCTQPLVDEQGTVTGEICHIKAQSPEGPRYETNQSNEERHGFDNLILMCSIHHKLIDDSPQEFTVDKLLMLKTEHESGGVVKEASDDVANSLLVNSGFLGNISQESGGGGINIAATDSTVIICSGLTYSDANEIALDGYRDNALAATVSPEIVRYLNSLPGPTLPPNGTIRARLAELLGFSFSDQVALMPNWQNVAVNKKESAPTPSWVTAQAVSEVANILREQHVPMFKVDSPWDYQPSLENLVAFGFETSQPLYRRVAGWEEFDMTSKISEFQGYIRHNQTGPFDLPWKSNLGTEADENDPKEFYYTFIGADKEKAKRRIWALQRGGTILRPEFDGNNVCLTDYISIVHIPNYLNSSKYTMTLAGGIQAAGTKAIGGLLADKTVMETILNKAPTLSPWQAIIRVKFGGPNIQPTFLVQDVAPIGVNVDILDDWRRVSPTF